jgi:GT2 family glycosyltransferase
MTDPLPLDPHQAYAQASALLAEQRWAEALPLLEAAIQAYPQVPQLRVAAGQCRQRLELGTTLLSEGGLNQARYQRWINTAEERMLDPLLPLRHDWWELGASAEGSPCWLPLHGGPAQPADHWPQLGWLVLRHPRCVLRPGALQFVETWLGDLDDPAHDPHLIYADEDRLTAAGERSDPWFKPGYTPESFWSSPWLEGLSLWRLSWLRTQQLPLPPLDLEQRWAWVLQALARQPRTQGLPHVLSHWSHGEPKLSPPQAQARAEALAAHIHGQGEAIQRVKPHPEQPGCFRLQWAMPGRHRCRIVIPTRDRADLLETCLDTVWRTRGLGEASLDLEFVVVDNGSQEAATEALFQRWRLKLGDRLQILNDPCPFNWSLLNNRAAADCSAELLLFLNNDMEALQPGWLEAMAVQALRPWVGCVGAVLLYPDRTIQHAGVVVGLHGGADHAYAHLAYPTPVHRGRAQLLTGWGAVTGACLMVRRQVFEQLGGFDEAFPVEFNDIEFCLRCGQLGYRHLAVPEAVLVHHESQSRDARNSATAGPALQRLQALWGVRLACVQPWWPTACSVIHGDGRPKGLEPYL